MDGLFFSRRLQWVLQCLSERTEAGECLYKQHTNDVDNEECLEEEAQLADQFGGDILLGRLFLYHLRFVRGFPA